MDLLERAIDIALQAHKGQIDKGGLPYILHPLAVMTNVETKNEKIVAVLHDVVEDTKYTIEDLRKEGFPEEILLAVDTLTRRCDEDYFDYINRVKTNELAVKIKIKDLEHNTEFKRITNFSDESLVEHIRRYKKAWNILNNI